MSSSNCTCRYGKACSASSSRPRSASAPACSAAGLRINTVPTGCSSCSAISALISYPFFAYVLAAPGFGRLFLAQFVVLTVFGLLQGPGPGMLAGLFPVEVRSTGMAIAYNVGVTVFGGFAPLTVTWLIAVTGSKLMPGVYIIAAAVLSIVVVGSTYRPVGQGGVPGWGRAG